ncbi:outer membrane beta-barrel protein [Vibrio sp. S12_S33]|uniref:outer membrane beta-barrel protein n=1 Tax=Vibrio sp. S12_S33 TaxID=2720223 RepID=UPI00177DB50C|nr:outer membrane beta-barrel protein [Vibrio sp. S12_S33]MBD1567571.1 porin family protein [Vibrio sp. S12_S33]
MTIKVVTQAVLLGLLISSSAYSKELSGVLGVGYGFGGDELFQGIYNSGESDEINANDGLSIFGGIDYQFSNQFFIRGTIGYKSESIDASNGEVTFSKVPFELSLFRNFENHKLGAGVTYHTGVELECSVAGLCNSTVDFKDAAGFIAQYEYAFAPLVIGRFSVGAKYTYINYKLDSNNTEFDGSGFDIHLAYMF